MAQSLSKVIIHLVFSTKNRTGSIPETIRTDLHAYMAGICKKNESHPLRIGGTVDHVHIACQLPRTVTIADLAQSIKKSSSKWIKGKDPACRSFEWQSGYGVFSVGQSQLPGLIRYIENQEHHHRSRSYQDELRALLEKHGVEYDERYVWD